MHCVTCPDSAHILRGLRAKGSHVAHVLRTKGSHILCHAQVGLRDAFIVTVASVIANTFESYLGASVQGRIEWLSNDLVNVIQITLAATLAVAAVFGLSNNSGS